jgi:hypothetical protein
MILSRSDDADVALIPRPVRSLRERLIAGVSRISLELPATAIIFFALVVFYNQVLLTDAAALPFDVALWHFPQQAFLVDQLARGNFPLWTPLIYGGMPFAADMTTEMFYPLHLGAMFIVAHVVGHLPYRALELIEIGHLFIAGMGAYALGRYFRLGTVPAICCGCTYMLGPYLVSEVEHIGLVESAAWVPLVALYTHRAMTRARVFDAALAGVFWSFCFLTGFFAAAIPVALMLVAYCSQAIVRNLVRNTSRPYPRPIVITFVLAAIGSGLCAAQVLPTVELSGLSLRTARDFAVSANPLAYVITILLPGFYDSGSIESYWGGADITQAYLYYGLLPLLLLPVAFRAPRVGLAATLGGIVSFGFLVALGTNTALAAILLVVLPGVIANGAYGFPFRVLSDLGIALLVGLGIESFRQRRLTREIISADRLVNRVAFGIGLCLVLFLLASYCLLLVEGIRQAGPVSGPVFKKLDVVVTDIFVQLFVLAWGYGALQLFRSNPRSHMARLTLVAALVVPLVLAGSGKAMNTGKASPRSVASVIPSTVASLRRLDVTVLGDARYDRSDAGAQLWGTMTLLWGLQSANGNNPFALRDYLTYRQAFVTAPQTSRSIHDADYRSPLGDLLGLVYVVVSGDGPSSLTLQDSGHWRAVVKDSNGDIYENLRSAPRAFVVPTARFLPSEDALEALEAPQFDRSRQVLLGPEAASDGQPSVPAPSVPRLVTYQAVTTDRVEVNVGPGGAGWLVATDVYYPGWVARIDGQPSPIRRADFLFRSVFVDANPHDVTFSFEPVSVRLGLLVTAMTWLAIIVITFAHTACGSALLSRFRLPSKRTERLL